MVGHGHHLLPVVLPVLVPPVVAPLGRGGVIVVIASAKVTDNLGLVAEVGLDRLLVSGVLGGNI